MSLRNSFLLVAVFLLAPLGAPSQTSHRTANPRAPEPPNVFDEMGKETNGPTPHSAREVAAIRQRHAAEMKALGEEIPQLIGLAQNLQERLRSSDPNQFVIVDLRQESKELEKLAHQIQKRIGDLQN